jgi:hypothetical protein
MSYRLLTEEEIAATRGICLVCMGNRVQRETDNRMVIRRLQNERLTDRG